MSPSSHAQRPFRICVSTRPNRCGRMAEWLNIWTAEWLNGWPTGDSTWAPNHAWLFSSRTPPRGQSTDRDEEGRWSELQLHQLMRPPEHCMHIHTLHVHEKEGCWRGWANALAACNRSFGRFQRAHHGYFKILLIHCKDSTTFFKEAQAKTEESKRLAMRPHSV